MNMTATGVRLAWLSVFAGSALLAAGVLRNSRKMSFRGASVVITGGSRGLGLEMARILAGEGARLTLLARSREELDQARRELAARGGYVLVQECDIRKRHEVEQAVAFVMDRRSRIDVLINNAGRIQVGPFHNSTIPEFEDMLDLYVRGPLYLIEAVAPHMKRQGGGRIVNISSIGGAVAVPHLVPYCAAKSGLTGLSDGVRAELAHEGILVTTVIPGLMRTGSYRHATFKGRHDREYRWFSTISELPGFSIADGRAARRIIEACRYGRASLVMTAPARLLRPLNALFPEMTASVMKLAARALPDTEREAGNRAKEGWELESAEVPAPKKARAA